LVEYYIEITDKGKNALQVKVLCDNTENTNIDFSDDNNNFCMQTQNVIFSNQFTIINKSSQLNKSNRKRERPIIQNKAISSVRIKKTDLDFKKPTRKVKSYLDNINIINKIAHDE